MHLPHIDLIRLAWIAVPLLVRSAAHHYYHKLCHHLVTHTVGHRVHPIGRVLSKVRWLVDLILVGCLALFGAATEPHDKE